MRKLVLAAMAVAVVVVAVKSLPDVARYLRIRSL